MPHLQIADLLSSQEWSVGYQGTGSEIKQLGSWGRESKRESSVGATGERAEGEERLQQVLPCRAGNGIWGLNIEEQREKRESGDILSGFLFISFSNQDF